jgi:hypothetical protein
MPGRSPHTSHRGPERKPSFKPCYCRQRSGDTEALTCNRSFVEIVYTCALPVEVCLRKSVLNLAERISTDRNTARIVTPMIQLNSDVTVWSCRESEARQSLQSRTVCRLL